jgi:pimeloyl-ACP methyl ester carboxylesterase
MATVRVREVDLHYKTYGSGSSCVVIAHGALGSVAHAESWGLRAAELAAHGFQVIAYDARGHGRSGYTARPEHYRPAALADDMLGLIDALGLEQVCVYGTSMGASTALMLTLAHPERVIRLVLRAPSPFRVDIEAARARLYPLASMYRWVGASLTPHIVAMLSRSRPAQDEDFSERSAAAGDRAGDPRLPVRAHGSRQLGDNRGSNSDINPS